MMISSQAPRTLKVNEAVASEYAAKVNAAGGRAMVLVADVMDEEQLVRTRDIAMERFGKIDGLVNAAGGVVQPGDDIFNMNLRDVIVTLKSLISQMVILHIKPKKCRHSSMSIMIKPKIISWRYPALN